MMQAIPMDFVGKNAIDFVGKNPSLGNAYTYYQEYVGNCELQVSPTNRLGKNYGQNYRGIAYKFGRKVPLDTLQCR